MGIQYQKSELEKMFDSNVIEINPDESYMYVKTDQYNIQLIITVLIYEYTCKVSLCDQTNTEWVLFDAEISNIHSIKRDTLNSSALTFFDDKRNVLVKIFLLPQIRIQFMQIM